MNRGEVWIVDIPGHDGQEQQDTRPVVLVAAKEWQDAAALDTLKELGEISKEEYDYYLNL